ncbi:calmodulin [Planoprotostelium fungivorum]|uniref:Calmodulin n=1 Tax=Planoprotostelium fungivorum TaxID=1890364 RepID=A0A2P6MXG4_9EUKA|nr:calmodulin [Planoprotostelium fungivorum]
MRKCESLECVHLRVLNSRPHSTSQQRAASPTKHNTSQKYQRLALLIQRQRESKIGGKCACPQFYCLDYKDHIGGEGRHFLPIPPATMDDKNDLMEAFYHFDTDQDGFLTVDELRHILTNIGNPMNAAEIDEFCREADNGQGLIDYKGIVDLIFS